MARRQTVAMVPVVTSAVTGEVTTSGFDQVRAFIRASKAPSTVAGYESDWAEFSAWCVKQGVEPLPAAPENVAAYIAQCAGHLKPGSVQRRLCAIAEAHKATGHDSPTSVGLVRNTMKGIRRQLGAAPAQKSPALTEDVRKMVAAADPGLMGARDRAIILLGFAGAFRQSEVVGLDVADLEFRREGLIVTVRRSKTDQEGLGQKVGIMPGGNTETCPVRAVREWLKETRIKEGPVFRSITRYGRVRGSRLWPHDVARVVKKLAERVGLDPKKYAGHSLRAGHITAAAIAEVPELVIMKQSRHKSVAMLRRYVRDPDLLRNNSSGKVGL